MERTDIAPWRHVGRTGMGGRFRVCSLKLPERTLGAPSRYPVLRRTSVSGETGVDCDWDWTGTGIGLGLGLDWDWTGVKGRWKREAAVEMSGGMKHNREKAERRQREGSEKTVGRERGQRRNSEKWNDSDTRDRTHEERARA